MSTKFHEIKGCEIDDYFNFWILVPYCLSTSDVQNFENERERTLILLRAKAT